MTETAAVALVAVVTVGPAVMLAPFAVARHLVHRHADEYGPAIRAAGRDDASPATVRATVREVNR
ncbi:hypothetical protein ABZV78_00840 [Micromonospora sp. NPDC004540]|uniref:hypothetical protein n=1 Tax=Micromonospora sp. NPDC004540 TaxID=3154457 RepID=UPI0033B0DC30